MFFSEMTTKDALKITKQKMSAYQCELLERMNAIEVDAHWFRRVFHTFAASFLVYYLLPNDSWVSIGKIIIPVVIVSCMVIIEYQRLRGGVNHQWFFGLRSYEKKRPASYLYFGVAVILLFFFFPQQIAIPCILCASFTDPLIGECHYYFSKKYAYMIGVLVSFFFFLLNWYKAEWWVLLLISSIGATAAVFGEAKKLVLVDDDFMIQMLPAILLLLLWQVFLLFDINILPTPIITPL